MTITSRLGLYLHIPLCERKCKYCDFLSFACADEQIMKEYAYALREELKIQGEAWPFRLVDSVFIGGGTPSLLNGKEIKMLIDTIRQRFNLAEDAEITMEANPNSLTENKMREYLNAGVNRLSIGIQSFNNNVLDFLGRIHDKNQAMNAFQKAKRAGFKNINLDLMFGIPGQTMKEWTDTVRQAIFLRPQHISLYSLSIEEGTPLYEMLQNGYFTETSDALDREMYHEALKIFKETGYEHYEISNMAMPGYECRHNLKYWSYEEYLGLGLGASSFINGSRYKNVDNMIAYIKCIKGHKAPIDISSVENYSNRDEMGIFIFTGLRKSSGINLREFKRTFGKELFEVYDESIVKRNKGLLILDGNRLYLTEYGMDVSNRILAEFV